MPPKKKIIKTTVENGSSSDSKAAAVKKEDDNPVGRTLRKRKVKIQTPAKSLGFKIAVKTSRKSTNTNGTAKIVKKKAPSSSENASIKRRAVKRPAKRETEPEPVVEKIKRNIGKSKVTIKVQKVNTNNKTSIKQNKAANSAVASSNNKKKSAAASKKAKSNVEIEDTQLPEPIRQSDSKENDAANVQQEVQIKKSRKIKNKQIVEEAAEDSKAVVPPPKKRVKKNNADTIENGEAKDDKKRTILEFSAKLMNGTTETPLKKYKGHVCIIVNVASKCGHTTSNYKQFVELHEKYAKSKGLRILAFPCNQFGKQEPADNQKICEFAKRKNVKFDLFEKISVNGRAAHPLWKFLTSQFHGPKGADIDWNFTKFLIDKSGKIVARYPPSCKPLSLIEHLEKLW